MPLSVKDIDTISEMITEEGDKTREVLMLHISNVNRNVRHVQATVDKHNGRLAKCEGTIVTIEKELITHPMECPINKKLETAGGDIRVLQDADLVRKSVFSKIQKAITLIGSIIVILYTILKIIEYSIVKL